MGGGGVNTGCSPLSMIIIMSICISADWYNKVHLSVKEPSERDLELYVDSHPKLPA